MNTLRNHFIKSGIANPDYTISYTAYQQVPFIGGEETSDLTMWETGYESEPLVSFKVVKDSFRDGYGEWSIKTSNPSCFYGLIKDQNGYEYSMDSGNFHTITGLIFPDYDYNGKSVQGCMDKYEIEDMEDFLNKYPFMKLLDYEVVYELQKYYNSEWLCAGWCCCVIPEEIINRFGNKGEK